MCCLDRRGLHLAGRDAAAKCDDPERDGGREGPREGGKDVCAGTNPASCIALGGHTEGTGRDGTDEGFSQFSIRRATTTQSGVNKIMLGSGNGQLNYCVAVSF